MHKNLMAFILLALLGSTASNADVATTVASKEIRQLISARDFDGALEKAQAQVEAFPNSAEAYYFLGSAYGLKASEANLFSAMGLAKKSRAALEKAMALNPKSIETRFALIQFHTQAPGIAGGDKDEATRIANELATIDKSAYHRAQAYFKLRAKDNAGAIVEYRAALAANPADGDSLGALCAELATQSKFEEAEQLIANALAKAPQDFKVRYQVGKFAALTGRDLAGGLAHLDAVLAVPNGGPEGISMAGAHWRRGQVLEKLGRVPEAITAMEKALQLQPKLEEAKTDLKRLKAAK